MILCRRILAWLIISISIATIGYARNKSGLLQEAIEKNDLSSVKKLFKKTPFPSINERIYAVSSEGNKLTAVELAIASNNREITTFLINHPSFNRNRSTGFYKYIIRKAINHEWWDVANCLITFYLYGSNANIVKRQSGAGSILLALNNNRVITSPDDIVRAFEKVGKHISFLVNEHMSKEYLKVFLAHDPSVMQGLRFLSVLSSIADHYSFVDKELYLKLTRHFFAYGHALAWKDYLGLINYGFTSTNLPKEQLSLLVKKTLSSFLEQNPSASELIELFSIDDNYLVKEEILELLNFTTIDKAISLLAKVKFIEQYNSRKLIRKKLINHIFSQEPQIKDILRLLQIFDDSPKIAVEVRDYAIRNWVPRSAKQFITLMKTRSDGEQDLLAELLYRSIDFLMKLNPTAADIAQLSADSNDMKSIMALKNAMLNHHRIKTPKDYLTVMDYNVGEGFLPSKAYVKDVEVLVRETLHVFFSMHPTINDVLSLIEIVNEAPKLTVEIRQLAIVYEIPKDAEQYIALMEESNEKERNLLADLIVKTIDELMALKPRAEQIAELTRQNGDVASEDMHMALKYAMIKEKRVNTLEEYITLMNYNLPPESEPSHSYVKKVSFLIYSTLEHYIDKVFKTSGSSRLVMFLQNVLEESDVNDIYIINMMNKLEEKERTFYRDQERKAVSHLTKQIRTKINGPTIKSKNGKIKFYALNNSLPNIMLSGEKNGECPVCFDDIMDGGFIGCANQECTIDQHPYQKCRECFKDGILLAIKENRFPLCCSQCHHEIPLGHDLLKTLNIGNLYSQINKKTILSYHDMLFENAKNCATPNCMNRIDEIDCDKDNNYICNVCEGSFCFSCGHHHPDTTCGEYQKQTEIDSSLLKLLHDPRSDIRPCPYCLVPTEKSEACDHMTCQKCKKPWDWRLGRYKNTPVHYSKNKGREARTYRVPGDRNEITGELYDAYVDDVTNDLK